MDRNFIIAIVLTTIIIMFFASPIYQSRFVDLAPDPALVAADSTAVATDLSAAAPVLTPKAEDLQAAAPARAVADIDTTDMAEAQVLAQVNVPTAADTLIIHNDDLRIAIAQRGGSLAQVTLMSFNGPGKGEPVSLIRPDASWCSAMLRDNGDAIDFADLVFTPEMSADGRGLDLVADFADGRRIRRTYALEASGYVLATDIVLEGTWNAPSVTYTWNGPVATTEAPLRRIRIWPFTMFMRDDTFMNDKLVYLGQGERTFTDHGKQKMSAKSVYANESAQKIAATKDGDSADTFIGELHWFAIRSKYFLCAAAPTNQKRWMTTASAEKTGTLQWFTFSLTKPAADGGTGLSLYLGPTSYDTLKAFGNNLTDLMELSFKFIRPLSIGFLWLIKKMHTVVPNWGLVIILFSIFIKLVLFPLSKSSIVSMRKMASVQPQLAELKIKHKNNPQNLNRATMELYKKEGINPFGGCLPLLLQMPVFFALYPVVGRAFELRQAMFIPGWIMDLSRPDPFYILPVAMGVSMFFQSKSTMTDPSQKSMLYIMPVMMVILFANFSSGLTLYWFMFNILTYAQQTIHRA